MGLEAPVSVLAPVMVPCPVGRGKGPAFGFRCVPWGSEAAGIESDQWQRSPIVFAATVGTCAPAQHLPQLRCRYCRRLRGRAFRCQAHPRAACVQAPLASSGPQKYPSCQRCSGSCCPGQWCRQMCRPLRCLLHQALLPYRPTYSHGVMPRNSAFTGSLTSSSSINAPMLVAEIASPVRVRALRALYGSG